MQLSEVCVVCLIEFYFIAFLTNLFFLTGGGKAPHFKPIEYRARPDNTICVVRLLGKLKRLNQRLYPRNQHVFVMDSGRKVNKNSNLMKVFGKKLGIENYNLMTAHGNRTFGLTKAARASTGSLHQESVRQLARHKHIGSQTPYLKPGRKERGEFFDALEGKKEEKTVWYNPVSAVKSFLGSIFGGGEKKDRVRELGMQNLELGNEICDMRQFLHVHGLTEEYEAWVSEGKNGTELATTD